MAYGTATHKSNCESSDIMLKNLVKGTNDKVKPHRNNKLSCYQDKRKALNQAWLQEICCQAYIKS